MNSNLYTESCLSFYDLKLDFIYRNKSSKYNDYFLDSTLKNGIYIKCRSDAYFVFNFSRSDFAESIEQSDFEHNSDKSFIIRNERLEIAHAFLACLRHAMQNHTRVFTSNNMGFIDNYIICTRDKYDLDALIYDRTGVFSTDEYQELSKIKLDRIKNLDFSREINYSEVLTNIFKTFDDIITNASSKYLYILGAMYRVAVYYNSGLILHYLTFLKSVYDSLAKIHHQKERPQKNDYINFLNDIGVTCCLKHEMIKNLCDDRNRASHELNFPNDFKRIRKYFSLIQEIFNTVCKVNISIPFGQGHMNIFETRE